jgi:hypothetical protein
MYNLAVLNFNSGSVEFHSVPAHLTMDSGAMEQYLTETLEYNLDEIEWMSSLHGEPIQVNHN